MKFFAFTKQNPDDEESSPILLEALHEYCNGFKIFELECPNDSPGNAEYADDLEVRQ